MAVTSPISWQSQIGKQRDWVWRGWQIRYTYQHAPLSENQPPFLLVHGFGASIGHWRNNVPTLTQHRSIYALDLLGFGASEKVSAPYEVGFWAEQLYDFWRTFIGQPVVLVGNSIGSLVCLAAATRYPEMVQSLVMLNLPDPSVLEYPQWLTAALTPIQRLTAPLQRGVFAIAQCIFLSPLVFNPFFRLIRRPRFIRFWAGQAYTTSTALTEELLDIFSRPAFDRGAAAALRAMVGRRPSSAADYRVKTVLPHLTIPMLLIWGKQDRMVPPKLGPLIAKLNPRLTLAEIEQAGHCPHDECPEVVNRLILEWLASQGQAEEMAESLKEDHEN